MAAAEQFSLRWNNFQSNMTSGFHSLWEGEDLVDVTLAADGRFLQAHKLVLSVCSPYFKTLFKINPCKHPIVILKDVGYKDLEALLQFMYRGEVNVCQEELPSFLKTAEMLEVKGLTGDESQKDHSPPQPPPPLTSKLKERIHPNQDASGNCGPAMKRKRTACPVSPIVIGDDPSSRGSHADYDLAQPKVEPTEDVDDAEDYSQEKDATESLATLLGGESSHGGLHAESIQGMDASMFSSLSSHPVQDSGGSGGPQDGSQGRHWMLADVLRRRVRKSESCPVCGRVFVSKFNLRVHMRDKHSGSQDSFACSWCGKTLKNKSCLRVHMYQRHQDYKMSRATPVIQGEQGKTYLRHSEDING